MTSRVAFVTGGTGGIGTAICRELANQGHRVVTNYRNEEKAKALAELMSNDLPARLVDYKNQIQELRNILNLKEREKE